MAANTLSILRPSVNNLTVRIFVRAAGLDFDEVDVWGKKGTPEFLAKDPADLERAKALCGGCPVRLACLTGAANRREPVGVWGGEIFDRGRIVTHKRPRGRPPKGSTQPRRFPAVLVSA